MLTLRFTEDSTKQFVNSLQLAMICKIVLLSEEYLIFLISEEYIIFLIDKINLNQLMYINILYIFFVVRNFYNLFLNLFL